MKVENNNGKRFNYDWLSLKKNIQFVKLEVYFEF